MNKKKFVRSAFAAAVLIAFIGVAQLSFSSKPLAEGKKQDVKSLETSVFMSGQDTEAYKVVNVADGDTIDLMINNRRQRIRLAGLNAPEIVDFNKSEQCFGEEAAEKTGAMLLDEYVVLETDTPVKNDGTAEGYVFLGDGTNYNRYIIREGYASADTHDEGKYADEFKSAQAEAIRLKKGLWGSCK